VAGSTVVPGIRNVKGRWIGEGNNEDLAWNHPDRMEDSSQYCNNARAPWFLLLVFVAHFRGKE